MRFPAVGPNQRLDFGSPSVPKSSPVKRKNLMGVSNVGEGEGQGEGEVRAVVCLHCASSFNIRGFRRFFVDDKARRPSLVKCPHCHWKFEYFDDSENPQSNSQPAKPNR